MASNRKTDIDHFFKSKLENHSSEVPTSLWDKISAELDQEEVSKHQTQLRGRVISLSWVTRIAAGLLLFGFIIWTFQREEKVYLTAEESAPISHDSPKMESDGIIKSDNQELLAVEADSDESPAADEQGRNERRLAYNQTGSNVNETGTTNSVVEADIQAVRVTNMAVQNEPTADQKMAMAEASDRGSVLDDELEVETPMNAEVLMADVETENVVITPVFEGFVERQGLKDRSDRNETLGQSPVRDRPKILSGVLNFVANNLQVGGSQVVEFDETEHGILRVDVKAVFDR